jgi:UDP-N-acetylmuramoylalanine-D-glutamate ligase
MDEAVEIAMTNGGKGDNVLLSPACKVFTCLTVSSIAERNLKNVNKLN